MGQISDRSRNALDPVADREASKCTIFLSYLENLFRIAGPLLCTAGVVVALAALLLLGPAKHARAEEAGAPQSLELLGTWYVVVHYQDQSQNPGREQWEDKVWTFVYRGPRLVWTEYSAVLFDDDRGRYESLASGRTIRSSGAWLPDAGQLREIAAGLSVDPQSQRSKRLRGDPARGFRSGGAVNPTSASVIGYSETWEIESPAKQPVFRRIDVMSSGRGTALDGKTEYRSAPGSTLGPGDSARLSGSFLRDGNQTGSFVMLRAGSIEFAKSKKRE